MSEQGLTTVIVRNQFYKDGCRLLYSAVVCLWIVNILLLGGVLYRIVSPPAPQYFAITPDGRMINTHPLTDPVVTDDYVSQWAASVTRSAFALDFINWRNELQSLSNDFTSRGWNWFVQQLKDSNNLKTIRTLKMVASAKVTGTPQILQKGVLNGRYAWKIQLPILVTYTNVNKTITQTISLTLIALRVPIADNPKRIAISSFIASEQPIGSNE